MIFTKDGIIAEIEKVDFDALTKILQGGRVKFLEKDHSLPETAKWLLDAGIFDKLPNK